MIQHGGEASPIHENEVERTTPVGGEKHPFEETAYHYMGREEKKNLKK